MISVLAFRDAIHYRLVFSWFFDIHGNPRNLKEKLTTKTFFSHEIKRLSYASIMENFAKQHFLDVIEVSIVISWEIDVETEKENFKNESLSINSCLISSWYDIKQYINQVWGDWKQIRFIAETQCYACWETQLPVATVYL